MDSAVADLVAGLDLTDPGVIADPYATLAALREAAPIFWYPPSGQWMLTRFDDVHATLRDRRLGRVYWPRHQHEDFGRPEPSPRWQSFRDHDRWSLLELEPPDHTRIRQLIAKVFSGRAVQSMRPLVEAAADRFIGRCIEQENFDLIADYAQPYSVAIICALLGVPSEDSDRLLDWSHAIVKWYELGCTDEQRDLANRAAAEFIDYARHVIAAKRAHPADDLITELVQVEEAGERLSEDEIVSTVIVLLNAGHEATVNSLGNGVRAMMLHRDQWIRLTSGTVDPKLAVEEMIRWDPPLQLFERWVLEEGVEIAGQPVPFGDEVAMLFGAANRDPRRFSDAARFDVGRDGPAHLGFGGGIHFCVGAPLARLELEVSLRALVDRCPSLSLLAAPAYHPTFVIRGLQSLPLRVSG